MRYVFTFRLFCLSLAFYLGIGFLPAQANQEWSRSSLQRSDREYSTHERIHARRINGECGSADGEARVRAPRRNLCNRGTASKVTGTGPWAWTCKGKHGGSTASCSAPTKAAVNGVCGSANGTTTSTKPRTNLCDEGTASRITGRGPWAWTCKGKYGGSTASCSASISTENAVNGTCGSSNGTSLTEKPTAGLCTSGTATAVSGTGPWTWSCTGNNGGTTASCSASISTANAINGTCGSSNGASLTAKPTSGLCTSGTATTVSGTGPWTWSCDGSNGGTTVSCSTTVSTTDAVNGVCGAAHETNATTKPTTDLCKQGTASTVSGSGPWQWTCYGSNNGASAYCTTLKIVGICGSAAGSNATTKPATGLCEAGTPTTVSGRGPWSWACIGSGPGEYASCTTASSNVVNGACGTTIGTCSAGTAGTSTTSGDTTTWNCTGSNGGTTMACTATGASSNVSVPIDSSWKLTFDEEFNGSTLDTSKWQYGNPGGQSNPKWLPENVFISNHLAEFRINKSTTNPGTFTYGGVTSYFGQTYGYFEARIKMPPSENGASHGAMPGFWMFNKADEYRDEFDIIEWVGTTPQYHFITYWRHDGSHESTWPERDDLSTEFHVYGLLWSSEGLTFYFDGKEVFKTNNYTTIPMTISLQNIATTTDRSVEVWNSNYVDDKTAWPAPMSVSYVHAYSNDPGAVAVTPQENYGGPGDNGGTVTISGKVITTTTAVNGTCGSINGTKVSAKPTDGLCSAGIASTVNGSGPWTWSCSGSNGGTTASCSASLVGADGVCGAKAGECTAGTASTVITSGNKSTWTCAGTNGGSTASCSVTAASCTIPTPAQISAVVLPRMVAANRITGAMGTSQEGTKPIYVYDLDYTGTYKGKYYAVVSSMAIDTDGSDANSDPDHQSQTTFQDAKGAHLSSKRVPFWVIDDVATSLPNFPYGKKFDIDGFQVGAVIYPSSKASTGGAKVVYAVLGDTQGSEDSVSDLNHIGEGSIALADAFGINNSGTTGGVDNDVMYVFSTTSKNRITPANGYTGTNATLAADAAAAGPSWACQMISDLSGSSTAKTAVAPGSPALKIAAVSAASSSSAPAITSEPDTASSITPLTPVSGNNNQVQINAALRKGGIVHLSAGTYTINDTINLVSGTTLSGDPRATVRLASNVRWKQNKPMFKAASAKNIRVTGFEVDGNRDNNAYPYAIETACGHSYYNMFLLDQTMNVEIDHMYLHHNWNDIVVTKKANNVNFHNNIVRYPGHDVVASYNSGTTYVTNNCIKIFCNSGAHAVGETGPIYLINNDFARETANSGNAGIEVQSAKATVYDCDNTINLTSRHSLLSGATLHTGGCPISPARALSATSCNVSDINKSN